MTQNNLNNHPTVSIIIPMFNSEKTISGCLDSIFAQEGVEFIPPFLKEVASPRAGGFMNSDLQTLRPSDLTTLYTFKLSDLSTC